MLSVQFLRKSVSVNNGNVCDKSLSRKNFSRGIARLFIEQNF